jgi:hypothetical protein
MAKRTDTAEAQDLGLGESEGTQSALATRGESALEMIPEAELAGDAGAGYEEERSEDVQIPTLVILQKMSPQLDEAHAAYLPGAKAGQICDTLLGRLFDGESGIRVLSAHFRPQVNLMKIDGDAASFVESFEVTDPRAAQPTRRDEKNRDVLVADTGYFLQDVALHFVLLLADGMGEPYAIRMRRTALRPSKRWNSLLRQYQPLLVDGVSKPRPRFSVVSKLRTVREEKDGKSWHTWAPEIVGALTDARLYREARSFHQLLVEGRVKVRPDELDGIPEAPDDGVPV